MKTASECIGSVVVVAKKALSDFDTEVFKRLDVFLKQYVTDNDLTALNEIIASKNLRKLTADDVVRVAYVHSRSIHENKGQSPYTRIIKYGEANGMVYSNYHLKLVTELLLRMGYMNLTQPEDRKKHQCRTYELAEETKAILFPDPK